MTRCGWSISGLALVVLLLPTSGRASLQTSVSLTWAPHSTQNTFSQTTPNGPTNLVPHGNEFGSASGSADPFSLGVFASNKNAFDTVSAHADVTVLSMQGLDSRGDSVAVSVPVTFDFSMQGTYTFNFTAPPNGSTRMLSGFFLGGYGVETSEGGYGGNFGIARSLDKVSFDINEPVPGFAGYGNTTVTGDISSGTITGTISVPTVVAPSGGSLLYLQLGASASTINNGVDLGYNAVATINLSHTFRIDRVTTTSDVDIAAIQFAPGVVIAVQHTSAVPEPAGAILMGLGLLGVAAGRSIVLRRMG